MLELEVELEVAPVAGAQALRPQHLDRLTYEFVTAVAELRYGEPVDEHDQAVGPGADRGVRQPFQQDAERDLVFRCWSHG